jgi:hypothetical protein
VEPPALPLLPAELPLLPALLPLLPAVPAVLPLAPAVPVDVSDLELQPVATCSADTAANEANSEIDFM